MLAAQFIAAASVILIGCGIAVGLVACFADMAIGYAIHRGWLK